jgi:ABC-type dipeptide/oligopeptide/nickel transport system permease component
MRIIRSRSAATGRPRWRLVGRRLLWLPVSLLVLVTASFLLIELLPGNPALVIAGPFADANEVARVEARLGLDRGPWERYSGYLSDVATGDLGESFYTGQAVLGELTSRLPATLELVVLALALAGCLGILLGGIGAYLRGTRWDSSIRGVVTIMQSTPDFLLALLLIFFGFYVLRWFPPPVGRMGLVGTPPEQITGFVLADSALRLDGGSFLTGLRHLVLPVVSLGVVYAAYFAKMARATMGVALDTEQVESARALGLPEWQVLRYAWLQARTPLLTYTAILLGALIGGAAIIETVFAWPGVGRWALTGILELDVPVIQGFVFAAGLLTVLIYLILDLLTLWLDPRIRDA